jgi:hypothetical protein
LSRFHIASKPPMRRSGSTPLLSWHTLTGSLNKSITLTLRLSQKWCFPVFFDNAMKQDHKTRYNGKKHSANMISRIGSYFPCIIFDTICQAAA